ncbi:hypothetical protein [Streptomyces sp. NPDC048551]|uniref:hypothetical protein n=1 Tax=Streptomyces sp. NPDC048551 TaxID=3155758 RepID=UPI00341A4319
MGRLLKATMPERLVREAILTYPAWPDIAAAAGHLGARRRHSTTRKRRCSPPAPNQSRVIPRGCGPGSGEGVQ